MSGFKYGTEGSKIKHQDGQECGGKFTYLDQTNFRIGVPKITPDEDIYFVRCGKTKTFVPKRK